MSSSEISSLPGLHRCNLVASPMSNLFTDNPPESNFAPWPTAFHDRIANAHPEIDD
jgi:hypothetical protein